MTNPLTSSRVLRAVVALAASFTLSTAGLADTGLYLGSKAPYAPLQDPSTYEAAPATRKPKAASPKPAPGSAPM